MKRWKAACAGTVLALSWAWIPVARAQLSAPPVPGGVPAIPGAAAGLAGTAGLPGAAVAPPRTLFGFLGITKANCAACRAALCQSQIGQMLNSGMTPLSGLSGGLVPSLCPTTPTAAQLAADQAAGGAQGVASEIKADEAGAQARVAAVEYLGTVDCRYWPDAEPALIDRLRADRNECVRFAAAKALGNGCCCTKKTIAALTLVVDCESSDGNPPERSDRVKSAAFAALTNCATRYQPPKPVRPEDPEEPRRPENPDPEPRAVRSISYTYYAKVAEKPMAVVLDEARRALDRARTSPDGDAILPTGSRSVAQALAKAVATTPTPAALPQAALVPPPGPPSRIAPAPAAREKATTPTPPAIRAVKAASPPPPGLPPSGQRGLFQILAASRRPRDAS